MSDRRCVSGLRCLEKRNQRRSSTPKIMLLYLNEAKEVCFFSIVVRLEAGIRELKFEHSQ